MGACAEIVPVFKRQELEDGKLVTTFWPPNGGSARDLPPSATLHPSVIQRVNNGYKPSNLGFMAAFERHLVENGAN